MDLMTSLATGIDIPILELKLIIHQPKIYEIAFIGEENFLSALNLLTIKKESILKDKNLLKEISNFQIFIGMLFDSENKQLKNDVFDSFKIIFPNYSVSILPKGTSLYFLNKGTKETILVDKNNFIYLQDAINKIFLQGFSKKEIEYNPANKKAKEIAAKIMKNRQKVAEIKKHNGDNLFIARTISILSIGLKLSYNELINYTLFQLLDSINRFDLWEKNDLNIKIKLAGGDPSESPEDNWRQNLYKK